MSRMKRRKLVVDSKVQGSLAIRLVSYWFISWLWILGLSLAVTVAFALILDAESGWRAFSGVLQHFWLPLVLSLLVLPIVIKDYLKVSNRFAGPIYKIRNTLRDLQDGKPVEPIKLRKGDFWQEFAEEINELITNYQPHQREVPQAKSAEEASAVEEAVAV